MKKSSMRKILKSMGICIFASGLPFVIIEELTAYYTIGIILMVVGIVIGIISNFYREKRSRD